MRSKLLFLIICAGLLISGCGDSGDSGASELAKQQELAEARKEAAQDARQSARIKDLQRQLDDSDKPDEVTPVAVPDDPPSAPPEETGDLGDWPGGSGYSAMLGAFSSEASARQRQSEATELGLDAGVLYSSNFSSLRPGYWVVFSGTFEDEASADARAIQAQGLGFGDAYGRFVAP